MFSQTVASDFISSTVDLQITCVLFRNRFHRLEDFYINSFKINAFEDSTKIRFNFYSYYFMHFKVLGTEIKTVEFLTYRFHF